LGVYILTYLISSLAITYRGVKRKFVSLFVFSLLLFLIGFRYEIGGDWDAYFNYYEIIYPYWENIFLTEPGYSVINFISGWLNGGIYLVNILSGFIFLFGLFYFIKHLPYPSLAMAIASSYLIFVVAMGYTRQSIAIGLLMIAYILFSKGKIIRSVIFSFLAVFFHTSALFGLIIILLAFLWQNKFRIMQNKKYLFVLIIITTISLLAYYKFFLPYQEYFLAEYVKEKMESKGAYPRVFLNFIAGLFFLLGIIKLKNGEPLWKIFSLCSILSPFTIPIFGSTTVDRLNLYIYPLQMISYSHLLTRVKESSLRFFLWLLIFLVYLFILIVWLLFAVNRDYWVPYKNLVFKFIFGK
jgi:hypothetical protein